jgi:hypothetical protein
MEQTIEERLRAAGYGHRPDDHTANDGRRTIYHIATGEIVGRFEALDALHLVGGQLLWKTDSLASFERMFGHR